MKYLKPVEKFDAVLSYLNNYKTRQISQAEIVENILSSHPNNFTLKIISQILRKLVRDGYAENTRGSLYHITFKGEVFMEDGGYTNERRSNFVRRQYVKYAHKLPNETSSLFLWFLGIVGVTGVYFLLTYGYNHWNWKIPF